MTTLYQLYLGASLTWSFGLSPTLFPLGVGADISLGTAGSEADHARRLERAVFVQGRRAMGYWSFAAGPRLGVLGWGQGGIGDVNISDGIYVPRAALQGELGLAATSIGAWGLHLGAAGLYRLNPDEYARGFTRVGASAALMPRVDSPAPTLSVGPTLALLDPGYYDYGYDYGW
jgi:hypothetical protein